MNKILLAGASALAVLTAGAAIAADIPSRRAAPLAPIYKAPAFTWTGLYVGANAGYSFGRFTRDGRNFKDPDGFTGGGQIGYNYQIGQFVVGLETDLQASTLKANGGAFVPVGSEAKGEWFGTVRGRFGITAFERALIYVTGGYAYGQGKISIPLRGSDDNIHSGYALGAGVEYALTNNWSVRGEYMYVDLTEKTYTSTNGLFLARSGTEFSTVRAGVNYKF
jgi:outer membrane immunogenic protein